MTAISVIIGSTRQGRFSERPAEWILKHLKKRSGVDARILEHDVRGRPSDVAAPGASVEDAIVAL